MFLRTCTKAPVCHLLPPHPSYPSHRCLRLITSLVSVVGFVRVTPPPSPPGPGNGARQGVLGQLGRPWAQTGPTRSSSRGRRGRPAWQSREEPGPVPPCCQPASWPLCSHKARPGAPWPLGSEAIVQDRPAPASCPHTTHLGALSPRPGTLHDFHSHEIAEQLTLLDAELFYKIEVWRPAGWGRAARP